MLSFLMKKFSDDLAFRIKSLIELGVPKAKIARKWGISRQTIYEWMEKLKKEDKTSS